MAGAPLPALQAASARTAPMAAVAETTLFRLIVSSLSAHGRGRSCAQGVSAGDVLEGTAGAVLAAAGFPPGVLAWVWTSVSDLHGTWFH
ncbi:hypothetical protein Q760_16945 [Cellulomonas cellasea DSM 20118]|uniref:Uncharacterized protein n=1 Tax=Cellulomonas cellasea DSM 20118 TaxID=1408250 RepID=A0A0A0B6N5_9CELL|nr:hypothetical protein Q760_16945 [Cellulomonas cellasea DSM 20118]